MVISARTANDLPQAAKLPEVELRTDPEVRGGTYPFDNHDFTVHWHVHSLHQIAYAFEGAVEVETPTTRFLLPPQQALWLPAGLPHLMRYRDVRTVSVFLAPELSTRSDDNARVLAAAPVLREMILYAVRWRIERQGTTPEADQYFRVLAQLADELIEREAPLCLPTSADPVVQAVMNYTNRHLATATTADVCAHAGVSPRSLRRLFPADIGMTWSEYQHRSRLLAAMSMLSNQKRSVLEVAGAVGFDSASAFTRAFTRFAGQTPTSYRKRPTA